MKVMNEEQLLVETQQRYFFDSLAFIPSSATTTKKDPGGENRPSGDSTKSALIHLPAAGEGVWLLRSGAVISKRLGDDLPSLGEWPHSAGA